MPFRQAIAIVPALTHLRHRILFSVAGAFAFLVMSQARADPITNGGFETPVTSNFTDFTAGSQPPGFGWITTSGGVDVVRTSSQFALTAFEGSQFLDLDGFTPGAIAQTLATIPGNQYLLSFAYANNPNGTGVPPPGCPAGASCATIPAHAIVSVLDTGTNAQLITPLLLTHGTSTIPNPDWTASGTIAFIAQGTATTLSFVSQDPSQSDGGIFLDAVSVSGRQLSFLSQAPSSC